MGGNTRTDLAAGMSSPFWVVEYGHVSNTVDGLLNVEMVKEVVVMDNTVGFKYFTIERLAAESGRAVDGFANVAGTGNLVG